MLEHENRLPIPVSLEPISQNNIDWIYKFYGQAADSNDQWSGLLRMRQQYGLIELYANHLLNLKRTEAFLITVGNIHQPIGETYITYKDNAAEVGLRIEYDNYRRVGIGQQTVAALIQRLENQKRIKGVLATVAEENTPSLKLFTRLGFRAVTRVIEPLGHMIETPCIQLFRNLGQPLSMSRYQGQVASFVPARKSHSQSPPLGELERLFD